MIGLDTETITFGQYKGKTVTDLLRDRKYCKWLLEQDWFSRYEYIHKRIIEHDPLSNLIDSKVNSRTDFCHTYKYFKLKPITDIDTESLGFSEHDKICYQYYRKMMKIIKNRILDKMEDENPYDIKTPKNWLQKFEADTGIDRETLKKFMSAYDLANITSVIEDVKKHGGIEYKGAKSFIIAKDRSDKQENYWYDILKSVCSDSTLNYQFKYIDCIFDFINISRGIIYECKLSITDFNKEQYIKYRRALEKYKIVYLIDRDCIINIEKSEIYTTDVDKYEKYLDGIPNKKIRSFLDDMILNYSLVYVKDLKCKL